MPCMKSFDKKRLFQCLLFTFVIGLITHGYAFLNFQPSHDSLSEVVSDASYHQWKIQLGRYLKPVYDTVLGSFTSLPWTNGLLSLLWISLAAFLIVNALKINHAWIIAIFCGILTANITVTSLTATYAPDLGSDMLALLWAVSGWWLFCRFFNRSPLICPPRTGCPALGIHNTRVKLLLFFAAISACLAASLALYQSYICVFITLVIIFSILQLLTASQSVWRNVFYADLFAAAATAAGGLLYFAGLWFVCHITGVSLNTSNYNSLSNAWTNSESFDIRLISCFCQFRDTFFKTPGYVFPSRFPQTVNILLLLLGIICLLGIGYRLLKQHDCAGNIVYAVLLLPALPFSMNAMRLFNAVVHDLMIYAFWLIYLFIFLLAFCFSKILKNTLPQKIAALLLSCILLFQIQTANAAYVKKATEQQATLSVMTRIVDRIEGLDDYEPGVTPVAFIGTPCSYSKEFPEFYELSSITGLRDTSPITYQEAFSRYISMILHIDMNLADETVWLDRVGVDAIRAMPVFPHSGSIQEINGIVIVKFNEFDPT